MSEELDRASNILAKVGILGVQAVLNGRAASNPHYVREEHKVMAHALGREIAGRLDPIIEDFIQEEPYGPASVRFQAEMVVMTRSNLSELVACIRTAQRREASMQIMDAKV